jgi:hypothetical protein
MTWRHGSETTIGLCRSSRSRGVALTAAALAAAVISGCGGNSATSSTTKSSASHAEQPASGGVTSSIADGSQLTTPVTWTATVTGVTPTDVQSVGFSIDGTARHIEKQAPYVFAGDGNKLIPGTLAAGSHVFAVDVTTTDGRHLKTSSGATVSPDAEGVPPALVGTWSRVITRADVARTDSFRSEPPGNEALPTGRWLLRIGADATARYVYRGEATIGQIRFEAGHIFTSGNEIPNVAGTGEGGFCPEPVDGRYRWRQQGDTLEIDPIKDGCADRNSYFDGTFTRDV